MDVRCDKCQARYRIEDARVASAGPAGLSMRCGKCGNIFKITKDGAAAASSPGLSKPPPAAAPSAPPPGDMPGSTMMFQAPKIPPAKAAPAAAPAAPAPSAPPPADLPGSTMMFQAPKIPPAKAAPAPAPAAAKPGHTSDDDSGSTMMFGTAPIKISDAPAAPTPAPAAPPKAAPAPAPSAPPKAAPAPGPDDAGSTMMFAAAPVKPAPAVAKPAPAAPPKSSPGSAKPAPPPPARPVAPPPPAPKKVEPATVPEPEPEEVPPQPSEEETASGNEVPEESAPEASEPVQARAGESVGEDDIDPAAMTGEAGAAGIELAHPPPRKQPLPKSVVYAGIALGAVVLLGGIGVGVMMALRPHAPSPASIKMLSDSRDLLDKDSLADFPKALEGVTGALAASPKSLFPEAHALRAEIELAWSDALADEAQLLTDKLVRIDDDKKKADTDAAAQKDVLEAEAHHKAGFEAAKAGNTLVPNSPDVHLALADYYRQAKKNENYDREIKKATVLKVNDAQLNAVEGARLLNDDDGAAKALPKLQGVLKNDPQNARVQYRIAQAQAALKNDAEEKKALEATLKLSPAHERAKLMLEAMKAAADAAAPAPAPAEDK